MSSAVGLHRDTEKNIQSKGDYRNIQVNMPAASVNVDIEFKNICMEVSTGLLKKVRKPILKNASGLFKSGQLTAIMGPSGAGKTSLLNALTGFSVKGVQGTLRAGHINCELEKNEASLENLEAYRKRSCYILQDDRLNPLFTVRELMQFAADLKLSNTLSQDIKMTVINNILSTLGLLGAESTRCCNLSGGQRKRLSIAVELVDNPPVLFLDEPTTGLDSLTSAQCITLLKELARAGRTIICTIHQPAASIYMLFDQVYILAEGMCIYNGPSRETVPYLASLDFHCPKYHNPADYVLEIANCEYGNFNEFLNSKIRSQHYFNRNRPLQNIEEPPLLPCGKMNVPVSKPREMYKFSILFKRCVMQQYRDWTVTHLRIILHIAVGVLIGLFYDHSGNDGSKSFSNVGYLLISCAYLCYTSLMPGVLKFPDELPILKKENFNNWYKLKTYYAAILVTSIPLQISFCLVFTAPSYVISGQPIELSRFLMFALVLVKITLIAEAFGNIIGTCTDSINGTFLGAITTCFMIVFAGFLALPAHMPTFMRYISHTSFFKQSLEALSLSLYGFNRAPLKCPATKQYCHLRFPKQILNQLDIQADNYWLDIGILFAQFVVLRCIVFYTLRRKVNKSE